MRLEKWALIAEIVGSIAIVVTLIILIVELRGNTDEMRAATLASIGARSQAIPLAASSDPELALLWDRFFNGEELSRVEVAQANQMFIVTAKLAEESFIPWREGRLDDDVWQTRVGLMFIDLQRPEIREYWGILKDRAVLVPEFVEYLDHAIEQRLHE